MNAKKFWKFFPWLVLALSVVGGYVAYTLVSSRSPVEKTSEVRKWPVWKTVKIGTYKSAEELRSAVAASGAEIGSWAGEFLNWPDFEVSQAEEEIALAVVSNADLGRPNGCDLEETCRLARELGLDKCQEDAGPQLRLQYPDQPRGERLIVIARLGYYPRLFYICRSRDGKLFLGGGGGGPTLFPGNAQFVFCLRK